MQRPELDAVRRNHAAVKTEVAAALAKLDDIKREGEEAAAFLAGFSQERADKEAELARLETTLTTTVGRIGTLTEKAADLTLHLATQEQEAIQRLEVKQAELAAVERDVSERRGELMVLDTALVDQSGSAAAEIEATSDKWDVLTTAVVPAIKRSVETTAPTPANVSVEPIAIAPKIKPNTQVDGRDVQKVIAAIERAPGLGQTPTSQIDELQLALVNGACINDALKEVFGRVNPHTFVSLLKDMELCGG